MIAQENFNRRRSSQILKELTLQQQKKKAEDAKKQTQQAAITEPPKLFIVGKEEQGNTKPILGGDQVMIMDNTLEHRAISIPQPQKKVEAKPQAQPQPEKKPYPWGVTAKRLTAAGLGGIIGIFAGTKINEARAAQAAQAAAHGGDPKDNNSASVIPMDATRFMGPPTEIANYYQNQGNEGPIGSVPTNTPQETETHDDDATTVVATVNPTETPTTASTSTPNPTETYTMTASFTPTETRTPRPTKTDKPTKTSTEAPTFTATFTPVPPTETQGAAATTFETVDFTATPNEVADAAKDTVDSAQSFEAFMQNVEKIGGADVLHWTIQIDKASFSKLAEESPQLVPDKAVFSRDKAFAFYLRAMYTRAHNNGQFSGTYESWLKTAEKGQAKVTWNVMNLETGKPESITFEVGKVVVEGDKITSIEGGTQFVVITANEAGYTGPKLPFVEDSEHKLHSGLFARPSEPNTVYVIHTVPFPSQYSTYEKDGEQVLNDGILGQTAIGPILLGAQRDEAVQWLYQGNVAGNDREDFSALPEFKNGIYEMHQAFNGNDGFGSGLTIFKIPS